MSKANTNIELPNRTPKWKMILFICLLALGFTSFGYALFQLLSTESGWKEIEANSSQELNCSTDFVFMYNLGASGISATAENKAIVSVYTEATQKAYQLFTVDQGYDGMANVYYINQHPNTEIVVDEVLYNAFELLEDYNDRSIYLAPVYAMYDDIFFVNDVSEAYDYDPYQNEEVARYYEEIARTVQSPNNIQIELLGDNRIILHVSDAYQKYAEEQGITHWIDFAWLKNAFITDFLAETMIENGYTLGSISSYDGFCRNLDESDTEYSFNIYDVVDNVLYDAAVMQYSGAQSIVYLRNYAMNSLDYQHYYQVKSGEVRTLYLDIADGKCKSSLNNLVSYSKQAGCAEVILQLIPIYIAETFDEEALWELEDIYSVYCNEHVIYYNDDAVKFTNLFKSDDVNYTTKSNK